MSNLTGDCEVAEFAQGSQTYLGDLFETGESEMYMVVLADDDYDLNTNFGLGQSIILYLNVPNGSSEGVPAGTYEGLLDAYTAVSLPASVRWMWPWTVTHGCLREICWTDTETLSRLCMRAVCCLRTNTCTPGRPLA